MAGYDTGADLAERMRVHAGDAEHLYGHLMRAMADGWEAGGPVREIFAGWEHSPSGSVPQLRLLGGLFRIVLTGRAPELVPFYPCLGGQEPPERAWPVVRTVLAEHVQELQAALEVAPQTNEVGRSRGLLVGIFEAVRRSGLERVRLLEPGASAGLNLLVDRFRFVNDGWEFGPVDSPLVLAGGVHGELRPSPFTIVARRGCDLSPVDASTEEGRLRLRSFVWPFQVERHRQLAAAFEVAAHDPAPVDRAEAGSWLTAMLAEPVPDDVLTVVWQSVTQVYWPADEIARVETAVEEARRRVPLAHVAMEFPTLPGAAPPVADLTLDGTRLATIGPHGVPLTLLP